MNIPGPSRILLPMLLAVAAASPLRADPPNAAALVSNAVHDVRLELEAALGNPVPALGLVIQTPDAEYFASSSASPEQALATNTTFRFASNTKNFTATAVLLLQQMGLLDITNRIADFIPGTDQPFIPEGTNWAIPHKDVITIEQLLRHSAGVYDVDNDEVPGCGGDSYTTWMADQDPAHPFTVEEMVAQAALHQLSYFAPDEGYHYSNTGYAMLAEIVGRVYSHYMGEPKTLSDCLYELNIVGPDIRFPNLATDTALPEPFMPGTIYVADSEPVVISNYNMSAQVGEGNGYGTLPALNRHVRSTLKGDGVLNADMARLMRTNSSTHKADYAMGCTFSPEFGFGHNGARIGNLAFMGYRPDIDVSMAAVLPLWDYTDGAASWTLCMEAMYEAASRALAALGYPTPPTLTEGVSTNLSLSANQTNTLYFTAEHGVYYGVRVSGASADVVLALSPGADPDSASFFTNGLGWTSPASGTFRLDVSAPANTPATLRLYTLTNTLAASRAFITNQMAQHSIPGCSIALVDGQNVVWAEGFGFADVESQTPVTTNTVLMIGSVSKFITALMAAQLADDGALDLDAPVADALPEFAMLDRFPGQTNAWTARAMLNHHSGIPGDIYNGSFGTTDYWPEYIDWLLDYFQTAYPLYPPNLLASYCNSGFNLVGEIIARHDGADYADSAQARIFGPLGMTHSSFYPDHPIVAANLATGYVDGHPVPAMIGNMAATGGACSRPLDVARLIQMVLADGLANGSNFLSPASLAEIGTPSPAPLDFDNYFQPGLGLDSVSDPAMAYAGRTWAKDGDTSTFSAYLEILPDRQLGVFVNLNASHVARYAIARSILREALLERDGLAAPPTPAVPESAATNLPYAALQEIEGDYVTATGVDRLVARPEGILSLIPDAQNSVAETPFRPLANGRFFRLDQPGAQYAFTNVNGRALLLRFGTDGGSRDEFVYGGYAEKFYAVRYAPPPIPPAWSNRLGAAWIADNVYHDDYFIRGAGYLPGFVLREGHGILSIAGGLSAVLEPATDDLAFVAGFSTRGDGAVRIATNAAGEELLWFGGYRCRNAADLPALQPGVALSSTAAPHENALFRYAPAAPGSSVAFVLSDAAANVPVRVFNGDAQLVASGNGSALLDFDADDTDEIFVFMASPVPVEFDIKAIDLSETRTALRQTLATFPDLPGIAVAAREPGFLPVVVAEGLASVSPDRTLEGNEQFHIASISKTFTAAAIFLLQQQGLLNISNTVETYAPELGVPRAADITVEHLLQHRSGLPDANNTAWIDGQLVKDRFQEFTVEEIVAVARHLYPNLMFEPGSDYHYSDTGFNILARIVENVSGTNYQAFVQQNVLDPLALANTFAPLHSQVSVPEPAMDSYMFIGDTFTDTSDWNPSVEFGCGSIVSSLDDLLAAADAFFLSTNLLSAETRALMMDPLSPGPISTYGRGCNAQDGLGWGHDGTMWGMISIMRADPSNGVCLAGAFNLQYEDERIYASFFHLQSAAALLKNALGYDAGAFGAEPPILFPVLPPTRQGQDFRAQPVAFNCPTNWIIQNLPNGLGWDPAFGTITGITHAVGSHSITVTAQNAFGDASQTMDLAVQTDYADTIDAVSNAIAAAMTDEGTVGVSIALVDDQDIVWAQGFGFADREAGLPVDTSTVFRIGSVSKAFTAALNLQYAERGLLDLDTPFTNYTPVVTWNERFPAARPIAVRDLMTHHSGLPGDLIRAGFLTQPLGRGYLETSRDLAQTYPVNEPGTLNNYCNVGFVLLEGIAEAAAAAEGDARPFAELANARLFDILGMDGTSYVLDKPAISNHLAVPYLGGQRMPPEFVDIYGTGSLYSRPVDMAQFMKALFSDAPLVLRPETRDLMIADHSTNAPFDAFQWIKAGLGWDTVSDPRLAYAGPAVWKNGATLLYTAQFLFLPEKKLGVAVVASSSSGIPMGVDALALQHALLERDGVPIPTNALAWPTNLADVSQAELDALAGVYLGSANYDLVESLPGSLIYRRDVPDDGLVLENLRLRTDGWFRSDDTPDHSIAFTNAHGRDLVLHRQNHGTFEMSSLLAERFTPPLLPAAWSNHLGKTWIARNAPADDYMRLLGVAPTLEFIFEDDLLRVTTGGAVADRVLHPDSDVLAWIPGLVNRGDSAVQIVDVGGIEHVLYAGYLFGPAPAELPLAHSISNTIANERFSQWYEIQPAAPPTPVGGVSDVFYQLSLSGAPENFLLRVYEADGVTPVDECTGNATLDLVSGAAPLVLSIQPGSDGPQTGAYQIDFSIPLVVRELVREGNTYSMTWQGPTGAVVSVEAAPFLAPNGTFVPLVENLAASNLLLQETFPAGPDPERFFRIIEQEQPTNRLGQVLLISDIHLSPFVDAAILPDLVAQPVSQWDALFAVATNGLFTRDASGWKTTSPLLLESALLNAKAAVPNPDAVLYAGDFIEYEILQTYTNLVPGGTPAEGQTLVLKTAQYVHGKLRDAFPDAPVFFTLGNNDTYLADYDIEESGDAFYADTAATFYSGALTNLIAYDAFAATYTNAGSYAAPFGPGRVVSLQTAYLSANYPRGTGSGWAQLEHLELELQSAEAAGRPVWILLHIPPGINPYSTWQQQQAGDPSAAASDWQEPFLETFCQIIAAHSNTVAGLVGGHYHNRSWQLIADPATTNTVAAMQIANGILYNHGNNPGFTVLAYDRETLAFVAEATYSLDVASYEGSLDPDVPWSIRFSQNQGYGIPDLSVTSLENAWSSMADFDSPPARHFNAEYSGDRAPCAMTVSNWPVYRNAIRYTTPTQFRNAP